MTVQPMMLQAALEIIQRSSRCGIVSHAHPDADALGSALAMAQLLRDNKIAAHVINESEITDRYMFLKGANEIQKDFGDFQPDCLIVLDCADEKRIGDILLPSIQSIRPRIVIDHHRSHDKFGDVTVLDTNATSTAELVLELARFAKWNISRAAATALFAGLISDTGSFRYSSVTAKTFNDAAFLVEKGANPSEVSEALFSRVRKQAALLQAEAIANAEFLFNGRCFFVALDKENLSKHEAIEEDREGLAERGRDIDGVDVSIVARHVDDLWRVSLRAQHTNVAQIAEVFGGGGHIYAAAFRSREPIATLKPALLAEVQKALTTP